MGERVELIQCWLNEAWARVKRLEILPGGEDFPPLSRRQSIAVIDVGDDINRVRKWTTEGEFAEDVCRCPGDLTLALYDAGNLLIGSATLHPGRISWERNRFWNDLLASEVELRLFLSRFGVDGASRSLLGHMISALNLHEGAVQFRPAGDVALTTARRVPSVLVEDLLKWPGDEAANLDRELVQRMTDRLIQAEEDSTKTVRELLAWLGTATWPAEAIAGDGQLARRMLEKLDPALMTQVLPELTDPFELMGAVVWAAYREDDAASMSAVEPAITQLLVDS
ncbi:hypothetical protein OG777_15000 [Micromonospora peucetia]|uniref:Uncharacterized protein n=1 Tax=Micromonospora peucetia TaxID=47871 RepID=A0A1C6VT69_9ACTN|nr:hypothetical protein [Micromonospora peucetia]MCX4388229.1 hypothetical protein [Micromonospora peucetia]SCL69516.1 hypothetical protein GA0070608_4037 [Micromonospora peucetia]